MKKYSDILKELNIRADKIEIKGKVIVITSNNKRYIIKEKNRNSDSSIFKYLETRNFNYFPKIYNSNDYFDLIEYIDDIDEPSEQRMQDLIYIVSLLHSKTSFYEDINEDTYKKVYEDIKNDIDYLYKYYSEYIETIEEAVYMSPSSFLFALNYYKIIDSLNYCYKTLDEWLSIIKEKKKWRKTIIHNHLNLSHFIKNKDSYLISWDNSTYDLPIYDLYKLYKDNALDYDFLSLFKDYEKIYPLLDEERKILSVLIYLPNKINLSNSEMNLCFEISKLMDYLDKTKSILPKNNLKKTEKDK